MNYMESDDYIGVGLDGKFADVVKRVASRVKSAVRRIKKKGKGASVTAGGKTYALTEGGQIEVSPAVSPVESSAMPGGGVVEWAKRNPVLVGVGALAAVALLMRRR